METLFGNVSTAVSGAVGTVLQEAVCMADDMRAIIVADEDEMNKKSMVAVNEKKSTEPPPISVTENKKKSTEPPSTSRFTRFKSNMVKRIRRKKEISYDMEVKGRSATLAKPTTKPDKRAKQIVERSPSIFAKCKTRLRFGRKIQPNIHSMMMIETLMNEKSSSVCEKKEEQKNGRNEEMIGSPVTLAKGGENNNELVDIIDDDDRLEKNAEKGRGLFIESLLHSAKTKVKSPKKALFDDITDDESEASIEVLARYMGCTDQVYGEQPTISAAMTEYYTVTSAETSDLIEKVDTHE